MEYICTVCNKQYSSYKSLWNHKKEYHPNKLAEIRQISLKMTNNDSKSSEDNNSFQCRYCEKVYKHASSKCKHEKTCASKQDTKQEIEEIKKQNEELNMN